MLKRMLCGLISVILGESFTNNGTGERGILRSEGTRRNGPKNTNIDLHLYNTVCYRFVRISRFPFCYKNVR
jgi:hypothetical protein